MNTEEKFLHTENSVEKWAMSQQNIKLGSNSSLIGSEQKNDGLLRPFSGPSAICATENLSNVMIEEEQMGIKPRPIQEDSNESSVISSDLDSSNSDANAKIESKHSKNEKAYFEPDELDKEKQFLTNFVTGLAQKALGNINLVLGDNNLDIEDQQEN